MGGWDGGFGTKNGTKKTSKRKKALSTLESRFSCLRKSKWKAFRSKENTETTGPGPFIPLHPRPQARCVCKASKTEPPSCSSAPLARWYCPLVGRRTFLSTQALPPLSRTPLTSPSRRKACPRLLIVTLHCNNVSVQKTCQYSHNATRHLRQVPDMITKEQTPSKASSANALPQAAAPNADQETPVSTAALAFCGHHSRPAS